MQISPVAYKFRALIEPRYNFGLVTLIFSTSILPYIRQGSGMQRVNSILHVRRNLYPYLPQQAPNFYG